MLLFELDTGLYDICNPVTRQWTELQQLPGGCTHEYALYFHQSSGEYRFLCRSCHFFDHVSEYYITSTGATEPQLLTSAWDVNEALNKMIWSIGGYYDYVTPVAVQDHL